MYRYNGAALCEAQEQDEHFLCIEEYKDDGDQGSEAKERAQMRYCWQLDEWKGWSSMVSSEGDEGYDDTSADNSPL